ncbi:unnamed protein product [Pleuronectes platessa]|uniref:Uncharacterized protein n=1 Tax=Pleuronectes platessa TaxID=8262 RepID=A0A9N7U3Q9_PLEPL|nr:unnamed protein product [Pleuronectes platessa]
MRTSSFLLVLGRDQQEEWSGLLWLWSHWEPLGTTGNHRKPLGAAVFRWEPLGSAGNHWEPPGSARVPVPGSCQSASRTQTSLTSPAAAAAFNGITDKPAMLPQLD